MPWQVTLVIEDSKNELSQMQFYLDDAAPISDVIEWVSGLKAVLDPIIKGVLRIATASQVIGRWTATPPDNTDVEEGAQFIYHVDSTHKKATHRIPTFDEAFIDSNSRLVNDLASEVSAYVSALTTGITCSGGTYKAEDSEGRDFASLKSALESFQRSRKRAK